MVKFSREVGDFNIEYAPRISRKGQVGAIFLVELLVEDQTQPTSQDIFYDPTNWILFIDVPHNMNGSGLGIVLISTEDYNWSTISC